MVLFQSNLRQRSLSSGDVCRGLRTSALSGLPAEPQVFADPFERDLAPNDCGHDCEQAPVADASAFREINGVARLSAS